MESCVISKVEIAECVKSVHCIPLFQPDVVVSMIQLITKRKNNGDSKHPCRNTILNSIFPDISCLAGCYDSERQASRVPLSVYQSVSRSAVERFLIVDEVDITVAFHCSFSSVLAGFVIFFARTKK